MTTLTLSHTPDCHRYTVGCRYGCGDAVLDSTTTDLVSPPRSNCTRGGKRRIVYIGKTLAATIILATVGLLARMSADVHRQGAPLDEALVAPGMVAMIWPFVGVNPIVPLQVRFPIEALFCMAPSAHVVWRRMDTRVRSERNSMPT